MKSSKRLEWFCFISLIHINRQCRDPEMWKGAIFAFDLTLSIMVFGKGANAQFVFKMVIGDQTLQVNDVSCRWVAGTFVCHCGAGAPTLSSRTLKRRQCHKEDNALQKRYKPYTKCYFPDDIAHWFNLYSHLQGSIEDNLYLLETLS